MSFKEFYKMLTNGELPKITVIKGPEVYLIEHTIKHIQQSFLMPEYQTFNYTLYEGNIDMDAVEMHSETMPFFDERRVVVFQKTGILKNAKPEQEEVMLKLITSMPDFLNIVFYEEAFDMRKKLGKTLKKTAHWVEIEKLSRHELGKWIAKKFSERNLKVSNAAINYLIDRIDYLDEESEKNLYDVENIVKTLADRAAVVNQAAIDQYVPVPMEHNIFKMMDAISEKRLDASLKILNDFINIGESPIKIFALISSQYRNMIKVKLLMDAGYNSKVAASKLDIHPFVAKKSAHHAVKYSEATLRRIIDIVEDTDTLLKSSGVKGQWLIEKAIVDMASAT